MLFVVGYHASGKSYFAQMLERQYGALHIETSAVVRAFKLLDAPDASIVAWAQAKEAEFGANFFDEIIVSAVRDRYLTEIEQGITPTEVVISGNRSLGGIQYIAEHLRGIDERQAKIFAVEVSEDTRYERFQKRDRREGDATMPLEEFQKLIKEEQNTGIDEIFLHADMIISNNGTETEFRGLSTLIAEHELKLKRYNDEGEYIHIYNEGNREQRR